MSAILASSSSSPTLATSTSSSTTATSSHSAPSLESPRFGRKMDNYKEIRVIGRGNFGLAHLVRDLSSGRKVVIKKVNLVALSDKEKAEAFSEISLLSGLSHQNIVTYITSFVEDNSLHLVTSFCNGGDLAEMIKTRKLTCNLMEEEDVLDIFIQVAMAVDYCHSLRVMHRDLKTSNVFITRKNVVKLGDFGIAKMLDANTANLRTVVGTPYYMSPEVCENKPYDFKSDVWSIGCVLYELCKLEYAFGATSLLAVVQRIVQEEPKPISPTMYSLELVKLIQWLLEKDPKDRPQIRKVFQLPFIRKRLEALARSPDLPNLHVQPENDDAQLLQSQPPISLARRKSIPSSQEPVEMPPLPKIRRSSSHHATPPPPLMTSPGRKIKPSNSMHSRSRSSEFASTTSPNLSFQQRARTFSRERAESEEIDERLVLDEMRLRSEGVERFSSDLISHLNGGGSGSGGGVSAGGGSGGSFHGRNSRASSTVTALSLDS